MVILHTPLSQIIMLAGLAPLTATRQARQMRRTLAPPNLRPFAVGQDAYLAKHTPVIVLAKALCRRMLTHVREQRMAIGRQELRRRTGGADFGAENKELNITVAQDGELHSLLDQVALALCKGLPTEALVHYAPNHCHAVRVVPEKSVSLPKWLVVGLFYGSETNAAKEIYVLPPTWFLHQESDFGWDRRRRTIWVG